MVTGTPLYTIQVYHGLSTDEKPVNNVPTAAGLSRWTLDPCSCLTSPFHNG